MRCYCCNNDLSDFDSTLKFRESNEYVDMCGACRRTISDDVSFYGGNTGSNEVESEFVYDDRDEERDEVSED